MPKICATCRKNPAVKKVTTARVGHSIWKCQTCIDKKSISFITLGREYANRKQTA